MKFKYIQGVPLLIGILGYSQVGIGSNVTKPNATVDIVSSHPNKALEINDSSNKDLLTVLNNGNVGINQSSPTTTLHIVGDGSKDPVNVNTIQPSATNLDRGICVTSTGEIRKALSAQIYFAGYMGTGIENENSINDVGTYLTYNSASINKLPVTIELADLASEFDNTTTYLYTPKTSGTYIFEMQISFSGKYVSQTPLQYGANTSNKVILGIVEKGATAATDRFIYAREIENSNDPRSYLNKGAVVLTKGKQYYFGIQFPDATDSNKVYSKLDGKTAEGWSTYFFISRVQ